MSRNASSGRCAAKAANASSPSAASATISSSGHASARLLLQALAHQRLVFGDERGGAIHASLVEDVAAGMRNLPEGRIREHDAGDETARLVFLEREMRPTSVQQREPLANVGQPDPLPGRFVEPDAGVGHRDDEPMAGRRRRDADVAARRTGSMPCFIAFSTSVISMPGGTVRAWSDSGISMLKVRRRPRRVRMMARYAPTSAASCRSVEDSPRIDGVDARRNTIRSAMRRAAAGAPFSASCCALPSVLNRKCGSICSCRSFSRDSASCRDELALPAPRFEVCRQRHVLAVAQRGDQRDHDRVEEAEHEAGDDDVAELRAVEDPRHRLAPRDEIDQRAAEQRTAQRRRRSRRSRSGRSGS